jgi:tagatose 6-phosphate kinase
VIADTHGPALVEALTAGSDVVKPNAEELSHVAAGGEPVAAARDLVRRHGAGVVVSLGSAGVVAATPAGSWEVRPATAVVGNPTGAGDALVAGLARGFAHDREFLAHPEDVLKDAVAMSAAAVHATTAGEVDPARYAAELAGVGLRALEDVR